MTETISHRRRKRKDAGLTGQTEVKLPSGKFLDALSGTGIATEIERGGTPGIRTAVRRLGQAVRSGKARKARLRVPDGDLDTGFSEMRRQRVGGELTNLGGTRKLYVPKRRK